MGPFCRAASDCALILDVIRGRDTDDPASLDVALGNPFGMHVSTLTLGVLPSIQDRASEVELPLSSFMCSEFKTSMLCSEIASALCAANQQHLAQSKLQLRMQFTAVLASQGVKVKPFELNYTTPANDIILAVMASEAAANFDYWQRSHRDDTNRRQDFWPPLLRLARMIPAVEYIQVLLHQERQHWNVSLLRCTLV